MADALPPAWTCHRISPDLGRRQSASSWPSTWLSASLCLLAAFLVASGIHEQADPDSPHGGAFAFLGALLVGSLGLSFGLCALAVARRWRVRWALHALPFVILIGVALFGIA